jgi:hypothetical protein
MPQALAPEAFAPQLAARVAKLVADLQQLPHGYVAVEADLDQGISVRLQPAPGHVGPPLWLELDLTPGPGYARFGALRATHQPHHLSADQRTVLEAALQVVDRHAQALATLPPTRDSSPVRLVQAGRVLGQGPGVPGDWFINPYVGCTIGCVYCNAQFRAADVRALDGRPARRWGSWIDAKIDAPDQLAREVRCSKPGSVIFSPVITDPYVPLEAKLGITRRCLEVLADAEFSAVVLSRSDLVLRDLDVLARLKRAAVGVSLPALDDVVLQRIEPRGVSVARRLEVLRQARAAGLTTFAVIQPLLATPLQAWLEQLVPLVDGVRVDGLQERDRVGQAFAGISLGDVPALTAELKQRGVATDLAPLFRHPH